MKHDKDESMTKMKASLASQRSQHQGRSVINRVVLQSSCGIDTETSLTETSLTETSLEPE